MRRLAVGGGVLTILLSLGLSLGARASAQPVDLRTAADGVQQVTLGEEGSLLPLVVERLVPGSTVTARFEVHRAVGTTGGTFASGVADVVDSENGCEHAEAADGDSSCGTASGQGELSTQLHVRQQWAAPGNGCQSAPAPDVGPTLAAADGLLVEAPAAAGSGDVACLVLVVDLPEAADNLVQSDSSTFALRIGLLAAAHEGDLDPGLGSGTVELPGTRLPATGLELGPQLVLAVLALLAGTAMLLRGSRP